MRATLLDCTLRFDQCAGLHDYRYAATFRVDGHTVRVRLCLDDYRGVSFAVAELLDGLRWTPLLNADAPAPASDAGIHGGSDVVGALERFARDLAGSADVVLAGAEANG